MKMVGAACLVGMTVLTCADVVGRFFRHPIFGSVEIVSFMAMGVVAMALPYTHKIDGHVGVEIVVRLFSDRTQTIIDICTNILSLILFAIVTWRMATYAGTMRETGEVSMNLELPYYVFVYIAAFCLLVFSLIIIQGLFRHFQRLREINSK